MGIRFRKQTRQPFGRGRGAVCFSQSPWVSGNNKADLFSFTFSSPSSLFPSVPLICCSQNSPGSSSTSISSSRYHFLQMGLLANPADILFIFFPLSFSLVVLVGSLLPQARLPWLGFWGRVPTTVRGAFWPFWSEQWSKLLQMG